MTGYITKALFILLVYVLIFRAYLKWAKNSPKKIKPIIAGIIAIGSGTAAVFFLTLFEVLFCLAVFCAIFIFREKLYKLYREMLSGKYGKLKAAGFTVAAAFALWLGLALFYRTDFGMPIGVQNYLFHKYNEEFDVDGYFGVKISGNPQNQLTCCPKNGNPQTDSFNVVRKKNLSIGSRLFASDNYYGIIIREDYEKYISDIVSKYFDEYKVFVRFEFSGLSNAKYMSDEFDKNTSLEDFFDYQKDENNIRAQNTANLSIMLDYQPTTKEKNIIINKIEQMFSELSQDLRFAKMEIITVVIPERCKYYDVDRVQFYYILKENKSGEYISSVRSFVTDDNDYSEIEISDDFFKNEEEE